MSRVCEFCGKHTQFGRQIARRGLAKKKGGVGRKITGVSARTFKANIQVVRALVNGEVRRVRICASCLRAGRIVKPPQHVKKEEAKVAAPVEAGAVVAQAVPATPEPQVEAPEPGENETEREGEIETPASG